MCRKMCYDKKTALTVLNERKRKGKKWAKEIRIYKCPTCEGNVWHLTSMEEYSEKIEIPFEELIYKEEWLKLKKESF